MEEGADDELMARRGHYWRLYQAQARQEKAERERMLAGADHAHLAAVLAADAPPDTFPNPPQEAAQ